jgi:hypothetical protein
MPEDAWGQGSCLMMHGHAGLGLDEEAGGSGRFEPTVEEMERFKHRMGIQTDVPVMGRPVTPLTSASASGKT